MGSILKRFDRPSSRKIDPVKSTLEHDTKSLHDSVAATLRLFMEDDQKKAKLAADKREMQARERLSFRAKNKEVLSAVLKRAKESKGHAAVPVVRQLQSARRLVLNCIANSHSGLEAEAG
jgi:hypothetical protein